MLNGNRTQTQTKGNKARIIKAQEKCKQNEKQTKGNKTKTNQKTN